MVAAVEVSESGEAAFASLREPAWHGLGTVFSEPVTTEEMLRLAHLNDWDIRVELLDLPHESYREWFAVVRTSPFAPHEAEILGVVGKRYNEFQNEELFAFGEALLVDGRWETAGSIKHGTVVFASLALDRQIVLDPTGVADVVNSYLLVHTSHDGSLAVQASVTPVRVVCQNTLNMALKGAKQTFKVRHTQKADEKIKAAREALGTAHQFLDKFEIEAQALLSAKVTDKMFNDIVLNLYPKPEADTKGALTKWTNKVDTINTIYSSPTTFMLKGTAWGAVNALTERLDWHRAGRGDFAAENVAAAASGFDVATNAEKARILSAVKTIAKVKVPA